MLVIRNSSAFKLDKNGFFKIEASSINRANLRTVLRDTAKELEKKYIGRENDPAIVKESHKMADEFYEMLLRANNISPNSWKCDYLKYLVYDIFKDLELEYS